jgi:hypothetical protein
LLAKFIVKIHIVSEQQLLKTLYLSKGTIVTTAIAWTSRIFFLPFQLPLFKILGLRNSGISADPLFKQRLAAVV